MDSQILALDLSEGVYISCRGENAPLKEYPYRLGIPSPVTLSREDRAKYRPRTIGYPEPLGKGAFEFAIYGDDVPVSIVRLTDLFLEHKAHLLNHRLDWNDIDKSFAAFYMVDMEKADCSSAKLAEILRSRAGVEGVRVISRASSVFGYSTFPIILNGLTAE